MSKQNSIFDTNGEYRPNFPSALHKATGNDDLRPVFRHVIFKDGYAYATDANILVRQSLKYINIEGFENLEGKKIHAEIFRRIYNERNVFVRAYPDYIEMQYLLFGTSVKFSYSTDDNKTPNFKAVIPDISDKKSLPTPDYSAIGINHRIFTRLISAMNIEPSLNQIKIILPKTNNTAIVILDQHYDSAKSSDQLGLIMPVMISNP